MYSGEYPDAGQRALSRLPPFFFFKRSILLIDKRRDSLALRWGANGAGRRDAQQSPRGRGADGAATDPH